jgi:hypothetical protein
MAMLHTPFNRQDAAVLEETNYRAKFDKEKAFSFLHGI